MAAFRGRATGRGEQSCPKLGRREARWSSPSRTTGICRGCSASTTASGADRGPPRHRGARARQRRHADRSGSGAARWRASVLEQLYARVGSGEHIGPGDFDGLIRHATRGQPRPATGRRRSRTRRRVVKARTPHAEQLHPGSGEDPISCSASAPPAPARPISRSPMPPIAWSAAWSSASSCRGRRSRPANGLASCRATCARRSIPTCARSTTRSTTCCRRRRSSAIWRPASSRSRRSPSCAGARWRNAFVILDEAQNTTSMQMKMFLTRLGEGSKMVVTGDPSQIDLPRGPALGPGGGGAPARWRARDRGRSASPRPTSCAATSSRASSRPTTRPTQDRAVPMSVPATDWAACRRAGRRQPAEAEPPSCRLDHRRGGRRLERVRPAAGRRRRGWRGRWRATRARACTGQRGLHRARQRRDRAQAQSRAIAARTTPTNVLSFPFQRPPGAFEEARVYLGDVVLAAETVRREAAERGHRSRAIICTTWLCTACCISLATTTRPMLRQPRWRGSRRSCWRRLGIADPYAAAVEPDPR